MPHRCELQALLAAQGFDAPEAWIDYARRHHFRPVPARRLDSCPHCGARRSAILGQYVYFSHLARLCDCAGCGLVYSDLRLPTALNTDHFETTYKDGEYFDCARAAAFVQLARLIARAAPWHGRVLDVGAATGRLMTVVHQRRPDLRLSVNDISQEACRQAEAAGFAAVCSDIAELRPEWPFDVVVMSDVIYQEPDLGSLWPALPRLVAPGGTLVVRVPNKLAWIQLYQHALQTLAPRRAAAQDRVPLFNPEHLYVFAVRFLAERLREQGFVDLCARPARSLRGGWSRAALGAAVDAGAWALHCLVPGRPVVSPSLVLTARRPGDSAGRSAL